MHTLLSQPQECNYYMVVPS